MGVLISVRGLVLICIFVAYWDTNWKSISDMNYTLKLNICSERSVWQQVPAHSNTAALLTIQKEILF